MGRGGIVSQRKGRVFEQHLEYCFQVLKNKNICDIRKVPTAMSWDARQKKYIFVKKSSVDFLGFVYGSGIHVAIEVKFVDQEDIKSWYFARPHQIAYLCKVWKSHGISFLILRHLDRILIYFPQQEWLEKKSIKINLQQANIEMSYHNIVEKLEEILKTYQEVLAE